MSNHPEFSSQPSGLEIGKEDPIRILSRSPHPYHHRNVGASRTSSSSTSSASTTSPRYRSPLQSSEDIAHQDSTRRPHYSQLPSYRGPESQYYTNSDSGTEADDEHFLKGLPAPKLRPHKGLRGTSDVTGSRTPSPMPSPAFGGTTRLFGPRRTGSSRSNRNTGEDELAAFKRGRRRRRIEILRRGTEIALLITIGAIVTSDEEIRASLWKRRREFILQLLTIGGLFLLYPLRIVYRITRRDGLRAKNYFTIPNSFDPAPLIYPPVLAAFVAVLMSKGNPAVILPNLVLGIASLPPIVIPYVGRVEGYSTIHWFISCIPLLSYTFYGQPGAIQRIPSPPKSTLEPSLNVEVLASLYPLHYSLCVTLHYLTTTSLLPAELHLLSIALINVLLLASSPQIVILKSLLWGGGIGLLVTCEPVIRWGVALARIPKWRFKKDESVYQLKESAYSETVIPRRRSIVGRLTNLIPALGAANELSDDEDLIAAKRQWKEASKQKFAKANTPISDSNFEDTGVISNKSSPDSVPASSSGRQRRHTLPSVSQHSPPNTGRTPSGRKKRTSSSSIQPFFALTHREAIIRKWLYAAYVYACTLFIILVGIRSYVRAYALKGHEPIGWALGYLFGNIPRFRFEVISANLERWIILPPHPTPSSATCLLGPIPRLRQTTIGPANTRLLLIFYYLLTITTGLLIVFRLSKIYEVDTRRKVFHFIMVLILLPTTFIDPTFCSLALSLILAIFLLLDLFRASQLPPLSKPIAYFLTPYVDGRDLRGPVVVSHIFLLIGCAVPLWLSLATVGRTGEGALNGWEIETRDVSMVSGVICVGMGDAAASLIGRRFGKHKWIWEGGKSIEGSVAFAFAVGFGLSVSKIWLEIGGWSDGSGMPLFWDGNILCMFMELGKIGMAAGTASLAEAVLTGGNDNVVVPVVLWLCVKGLGI